MSASFLWLLVGGAYCFWRYAKKPFDAVSKTLVDLHSLVLVERGEREALAQRVQLEFGLRKALVLDDATIAKAELRQKARGAWGLEARVEEFDDDPTPERVF